MDPLGSITEWAAKLPAGSVPQGQDRAAWQAERDEAVRRIHDRFSRRVLGLVRKFFSEDLRRRGDEEDIAQSALKSFVFGQEGAASPLASREDLWALLATIVRRKALNFCRHHRQACRDVKREEGARHGPHADSSRRDGLLECAAASDSSPDTEVIARDTIAWLATTLGPPAAAVAVLRADDHTVDEIAAQLDLCRRSVQLKLRIIRDELTKAMTEN